MAFEGFNYRSKRTLDQNKVKLIDIDDGES